MIRRRERDRNSEEQIPLPRTNTLVYPFSGCRTARSFCVKCIRKPVFALVLPTCHRHVGFEWVRIHPHFPHQQKTHQRSWWRSTGKVDSIARFPMESGKEKTSVRTGFANMPPACWIRVGSNPRIFPHQQKTHQLRWWVFCWWGKVDSNHRSYKQQIYSLSPLATREFPHMKFACLCGAGRRTRTPDLLITNQLLYQLSYTGRRSAHIRLLYYTMFSANVKTI